MASTACCRCGSGIRCGSDWSGWCWCCWPPSWRSTPTACRWSGLLAAEVGGDPAELLQPLLERGVGGEGLSGQLAGGDRRGEVEGVEGLGAAQVLGGDGRHLP